MPGKFCSLLIGLLFICPLYSQKTTKNQAYFKGDTSKVALLISLSQEYNGTDINKSLEYAKEAVSMAEKISYIDGRINAYSNIAVIYGQQREFNKSIHFYTKQLRLTQAKKDSTRSAGILNNLGIIYIEAKHYKKAAKCFIRCINFSQKGNNHHLLIANHNNLGMIYMITKQYPDAEKQFKKAIQLAEHSQEKSRMEMSSISYLNLNDDPKSYQYVN